MNENLRDQEWCTAVAERIAQLRGNLHLSSGQFVGSPRRVFVFSPSRSGSGSGKLNSTTSRHGLQRATEKRVPAANRGTGAFTNTCAPARTAHRRLTPRSSGAPTAGHQARACGTPYIVTGPGLASCRRRPLSSNVRRHKNHRAGPPRRMSSFTGDPR